MILLLLCLLNLTGTSAGAESRPPEAIEALQGIIDIAYNLNRTSLEVTDEDHNAEVSLPCVEDAQCINEKIAREIKNQSPEGTIVKTLLVFQNPNPADKKSLKKLLQTGDLRLPFEINGQKVYSHQVLEVKVPAAAETYIFDPTMLKVPNLLSRNKWEELITSRNGVLYKRGNPID